MIKPVELIAKIASRFGIAADGMDNGENLDRMLDSAEAHSGIGTEITKPHPLSSTRVPFTSHVSMRQTAISRMSWRRLFKILSIAPRMRWQMLRGARFYKSTFTPKRHSIGAGELHALEQFMKQKGAMEVGYVPKVDPRLIFKDKTIPHPHAIVFSVPMDKDDMQTSPSERAFTEVMKGYTELGSIAGDVTRWLRRRGFAAYPGTNIGGTTDYPAMAEAAGIGAIGYHGLLISPGAGARIRLNVIYVSIENLPSLENEHLWVRDVCENCRQCVRTCPPRAIEPEPVSKENGYKRSIKASACRDYFTRNWGCGVCLAICPFSRHGYDQVKRSYDLARPKSPPETSVSTVSDTKPVLLKDERRVAIVGAGPAGFYLAKTILESAPNVLIDLFERLPYPHGLVRYGVAPDHPEVRDKGWTYDRMLDDQRLTFRGGLELGKQIEFGTLREAYDAVCLTTGARGSRSLGIQGEHLQGSFSAADFVRWYNCHPDYRKLAPKLGEHIVIIGHGNVALDTARILLSPEETLQQTDILEEAVETIRSANIKTISILGRSGPSQTSFTPKELVELLELKGVSFRLNPAALLGDVAAKLDDAQAERRRLRNLELFQSIKNDEPFNYSPHVDFRFFASPVEIVGDHSGVRALKTVRNQLIIDDDRIRVSATREFDEIPCDTVIRAIGFADRPLPGIPFNEKRSRIPTDAYGRVMSNRGRPLSYVYTSGWARRGAMGVIGTNKIDAEQVARTVLEDLADISDKRAPAAGLARQPREIKAAQWNDLAAEERRRGAIIGRKASKFVFPIEAYDWLTGNGRRVLNDPFTYPDEPELGRPDSRTNFV